MKDVNILFNFEILLFRSLYNTKADAKAKLWIFLAKQKCLKKLWAGAM